MRFLVIENEKIIADYDGDQNSVDLKTGQSIQEIPNSFTGRINQNINEFDSSFKLKPLLDRVSAGYVKIPSGYKIENDQFVSKTNIEKYEDGDIDIPKGFKIEAGVLVSKSMREQCVDGEISLLDFKAYKLNTITEAFENELQTGSFMSVAIGIRVDCRRNNVKNDLQNVQGLYSNMVKKNIKEVKYKGETDEAVVSETAVGELIAEMEEFGLGLYEKKWAKETLIKNSNDIEEINSVIW